MPSKKFITIVLAIFLLGAGVFWLGKSGSGEKGTAVFERQQGGLMPFQENNSNSSWEEVLQKASTYSSVDENILSNQASENDSVSVSETEKLSQNFIAQFLIAMQANGGNLDEAATQKLVSSLEKSVDTSIPLPIFKIFDIRISTDNSKEAIKNYANQLSAILMKYVNPPPSTEVYIFKEMADKQDQSLTDELAKSVLTYDGLKKDSLALVVPSELRAQHLKLVNSFALLKNITERFQNYFTDPLGSFVALQQYPTLATDMANSVIEIRNYLKNKNVVFSF